MQDLVCTYSAWICPHCKTEGKAAKFSDKAWICMECESIRDVDEWGYVMKYRPREDSV